jgi:hypothetical protein
MRNLSAFSRAAKDDRRLGRLLGAAALAAVLSLTAPPPVAAQQEITVQGEIVDLACYLAKGLKGPSHRTCAQKCAERGIPIGVLTDDGKLYLLLEDHSDDEPYEDAKELAGQRAEVKGKQFSKPGIDGLVVAEIKGL